MNKLINNIKINFNLNISKVAYKLCLAIGGFFFIKGFFFYNALVLNFYYGVILVSYYKF